jgi:uncharacterized protein YutE (UPF0331/DUF86 family)
MLNQPGIRTRLADLRKYFDEMEPLRDITLEEYKGDAIRRHAIERLMELIIECSIDINGLIIAGSGRRPPGDYRSSFLELATIGVVSPEFASSLVPMARLRNMLAHEYEAMNDEEIHANIPLVLNLFSQYFAEISRYIKEE